jgi:CHAD domain-containing protein
MAQDHREIEDKYDVDMDRPVPRLDEVPGVASVDDPVEYELEATYFDTPGLALTAAAVTLRRRTGGEDAGWHLKLPTPEGRLEVRVPLARATRTVPKQLRTTVLGLVRDEPMSPIATVRTRRTVYRMRDKRGRALADLSDDHVAAHTPATDHDEATSTEWREWEIELVEGDRPVLEWFADTLVAGGATPSTAPSKLARALDDRVPGPRYGPPPVPRRKGAAADLAAARLLEQVTELRRRDPQVRHDVPDSVHKMRVALRRLRGALATYRPLLDRELTDPLRDELKWLGGELSDARDVEVTLERLQEMIAAEPAVLVRGPVLRRVRRELGEQYRAARARALTAMQSERYFTLLDKLDDLLADPPWTDRARGRLRDVLPGRVNREWKRLARRVSAVSETDDPVERDVRLHAVRKAAKRARYAAEPMVPLYGDDAASFVRATKTIQTVLGDHQDAVVAQPRLREMADRAAAAGENAFTFGVLDTREEALAARTAATFEDTWRAASRKRLRAWLS